eukprot:gene21335-24205_t
MRPSLGSENRYQTGVIFLKAVKKTRRIVKEWLNLAEVGIHAVNTSSSSSKSNKAPENNHLHSDQWLFNQLLLQQPTLKSLVHILSPRHLYNAFPAYHIYNQSGLQPNSTSYKVAQFWEDLKLPQGDEVDGVSQMVYLAVRPSKQVKQTLLFNSLPYMVISSDTYILYGCYLKHHYPQVK